MTTSASHGILDTRSVPEKIYWGRAAADALPDVLERLKCERAVLLVSSSLRKNTKEIDAIAGKLGTKCKAIWDGMAPHTPRESVLECANLAREVDADVIVTIGGGSLTDGGKVIRTALALGVTDLDGLSSYSGQAGQKLAREGKDDPIHMIPQVVIPTTLSAGEFSMLAGCTNVQTRTKEGYIFPEALTTIVIFDPYLVMHTPDRTFFGTGLRAVDHCVEALCCHTSNPYADSLAKAGLLSLIKGLRASKQDGKDAQARLMCQLGIFQAMQAMQSGGQMGASHAIGHILGPLFDVAHGETSCVALPGVLRWNSVAGPGQKKRQQLVVEAFVEAGAATPDDSASHCVKRLVQSLDLPDSMAAVNVPRSALEACAKRTMKDPLVRTNPRRIEGWRDVLSILELCGPFAPEAKQEAKL